MSTRKFTGVPFIPKKKCKNCKNLARCQNNDQSLTAKSLLLDCESFYYLFTRLEEFEKHPILNGDIEKYRIEMDTYEKRHEGIPYLTPPLVTNGAFAAELALKYLIFKENREYQCIHDLKKLFNQLPNNHKKYLTEAICKHAHQNEDTLDSNLSNIANLFEDWRYFFGKEQVGYTNFFNEFVHITCDYAISQKPADTDVNETI